MKTYRFKQGAGKHRMKTGQGKKAEVRLLKPGDVVELSDAQYQACRAKFELADALDSGPSSTELFALAEAKKKEEEKAAAEAKAAADAAAAAKAKEAEAAKKAEEARAAKTGADKKG
jgi:colicin import membrane protein